MSQLYCQPHPFKTEVVTSVVQAGLTIQEIVDAAITDEMLLSHCHIFIGDQIIDRKNWRKVRPKNHANVYIKVLPQGGGGGGRKSTLRTVLTIAVIAGSFYFAPILGASLSSSTGLSLTAAKAIAGGAITVGGNLLVDAIAPIRPPAFNQQESANTSPSFFAEGARNQKRPFGTIPVVLGEHRAIPPLATDYVTEVIGDDNYLRMLVVWGYGRLDVSNIKIGETLFTEFEDAEIQTREGTDSDDALTLFPNVIEQENLSITLRHNAGTEAGVGNATRTAPVEADEISVDISFPIGLIDTDLDGNKYETSVTFDIQFREVGTSTFSFPTFTQTTTGVVGSTGEDVKVTRKHERPFVAGFRWDTGSRKSYEVKITRKDEYEKGDGRTFGDTVWSAIRAFQDEDPVNFDFPLAKSAIRIRATDQLNGIIDDLNATVKSYVLSFAGGSWSSAISSNPADLYRHVLQCSANARPLAEARLDLTSLQEWWTFCNTNGFEFNQYRDYKSSVWETLSDIAAAGRASPSQKDGKWSITVDKTQTTPVQHFTPRNSSGFKAEKTFPGDVHALKVQFVNKNNGYQKDERIVYHDGFSVSNATKFEKIDALGIVDPDQIFKYGRFHLAQALGRQERYRFNVDFENLVANRGDLILLTHDVINAGITSGRIKELQTSGGNVTGFTSDEILTMEADKTYSCSFRTVADKAVVKTLTTSAGEQTTVVFATPFSTGAIAVGDLFGFGESGTQTEKAIILSVSAGSDMSAEISAIPYVDGIYTADTGTIPDFTTLVRTRTQKAIPQAVIIDARSDESMLLIGAGNVVIPRIGLTVQGINDGSVNLEIQIKRTVESGYEKADISQIKGNTFYILGVEEDESYDIRARWNDQDRALTPDWAYLFGHRVVGRSTPPADISGLSLQAFGSSAFLAWNQPNDLDVKFGGTVKFRHSPQTASASAEWPESTSIGRAASANTLEAVLPLKAGTYLARIFDSKGVPSSGVSKISTKQASVLTFANVTSVTENPNFTGTKTSVIVDTPNNSIKLVGASNFDTMASLDAISDFDNFGGAVLTGTYEFAQNIDLTSVKKVRLTSSVTAASFNPNDLFDDRTATLDIWENFDGTTQAQGDCRVQVRTTDDNPASGSATFTDYNLLDSAEFEARGFDFRAILTTEDPAFNIRVTGLSVTVDEVT